MCEEGEVELLALWREERGDGYQQYGMIGVQLQGRMYDMGNYSAFVNCVSEYSR